VSTPDPALIDTDVASVLYRSRLFQRVVPAELVQAVSDRRFEPLTLHGLALL
jgi:hypothetical protein